MVNYIIRPTCTPLWEIDFVKIKCNYILPVIIPFQYITQLKKKSIFEHHARAAVYCNIILIYLIAVQFTKKKKYNNNK